VRKIVRLKKLPLKDPQSHGQQVSSWQMHWCGINGLFLSQMLALLVPKMIV
jgi:hypothetical protein